MAWDDEKKEAVVKAYKEAEPTAENTMEIVKEIAEEFDESPNGVRMVLSKAGVYVTKAQAKSGGGEAKEGGSKRVSKEDAQNSLTAALEDAGVTADQDIISKLTGKAAVYFTQVVSDLNK